ncbi:hypothetical protein GC194_03955 [bacterium]|nr:hypothetical protein [bacterium]
MSALQNKNKLVNAENAAVKVLSFKDMGLTHLPVDLQNFPNLERLDLSGNRLTVLPAEIGELKKLKVLKLSGNFSLNWSRSLMHLMECRRLQQLDISFCNLKEIPAELYHFDRLKNLDLSGNAFNPFSDRNVMNLPEALQVIKVLDCDLFAFSNSLKKRQQLKKIETNHFEFDYWQQMHWIMPQLEVALS